MQISVTIPNGLVDTSKGRLISKTDLGDGYTRWDWRVRSPINSYNVAVFCGYNTRRMPAPRSPLSRYWQQNLRLMAILLAAWASAGLGCGVLFADRLNESGIRLGGFPLGFWFAQQGSIIIFILLILAYALAMNRIDAGHHRDRLNAGDRAQ